MEQKVNLRRGFLIPIVAVLSLFASLLLPIEIASAAPAPTVTAVSPTRGTTLGGTQITITGTRFTNPLTVTVGGVAATSPTWVNNTTATAITPAGTTGAKNIVVTRTGDGLSGTGTNLFTYGYSVTYDANNATSGTVPVDSTIYDPSQTVTVLGNTGSLARTNYVFSNWNTAANGSGTSYSGGNTFAISNNTTLYAQWTPTYTVIYNGNGNTSGTVPIDSSSPYVNGATVTVLGNTGSLAKTGSTFSNWNTAANGSGTSYVPTNTFLISSNIVLYAQWRASITYNANGATGGSVPVDPSSPYLTGSTVTVLGNTGSLTKTGNNFASWNTAANGSGTTYTAGNTFALTADTVLYAQWSAITYTVTYDGNGNTGGSAPVDGSSPYAANALVTVLGNTGSLVKSGYSFSGWNTAANGSGTSYAASATFNINANTTLYAQWASTFTVVYNGNGNTSGTAPLDSSSPYSHGATITVKGNSGVLAKIGYVFTNWNTSADGTGTSYSPGATFVADADTVLYAHWTAVFTILYDGDGATGGVAPIDSSSPYTFGSTVTVLGNTGSLVRAGNTFSGWNTVEDGSGTPYAPGATFSIAANTTLFAQWTATVTYDPDGATSGTVPIDSSSPYPNPFGGETIVTVLGNPGSLVRTGYTFAHWGTGPNNTGEHYRPGDQFILQQNTILYAHWELIGYHNVVYNDNGATAGTVPIDTNNPYVNGATVTVLGNTGSLSKSGSLFEGWNTAADGSGTLYKPSNQFVINAATILYAEWESHLFTVTYDGNGATSGNAPVDANNPYDEEDSVRILSNSGNLARTGFTFVGWNTAADGSGTTYGASGNEVFQISSDTTLYAHWLANHVVTFNANGGTGTMASQSSSASAAFAANVFTRVGYTFNGWNTEPNGAGTNYVDRAVFSFASDLTLYAQWTAITPPYTPPVITSPITTIESPVSESIDNDEATESVVEAAIELAGGIHAEVSVTVPPGAFTVSSIAVSITPASTTAAVTAGLVAIRVTATDSAGAPVTHFEKPLAINLGRVITTAIPMYSEDGIHWIPIPLIIGTTLPSNMEEGYYVASDGRTVILTRHLTYFGVKKMQKSLFAAPRRTEIEVGKFVRVMASGGSGRGVRSFTTSTPSICGITSGGLLIPLAEGVCTFQTVKAGDSTYAAAQSLPNNIVVHKAPQRNLWISSSALSIRVGQKAVIEAHGGSGTGVLTFKASAPAICSVSAQGVVTGLQVGSCLLTVTKASDQSFLPSTSKPLLLNVTKIGGARK